MKRIVVLIFFATTSLTVFLCGYFLYQPNMQDQSDPISYVFLDYEEFNEDEVYWEGYIENARQVYDSIIYHTDAIVWFSNEDEAKTFMLKFYWKYGLYPAYQSPSGKEPSMLYYQQEKYYQNIYEGLDVLSEIQTQTESIVKEGISEKEAVDIIWQYIVNEYAYTDGFIRIQDMLEQKCGNCTPYATLFRQMCRSVGIECDVLVGNAYGRDGYALHAWNRVKIGDDWYYYDLTFYDTYAKVGKNKYIHSSVLWDDHESFTVQNGLCYIGI